MRQIALKALTEARIDDFFAALDQVTVPYDKNALVREGLEVAELRSDVGLIKRLLTIELSQYERKAIYISAVQILMRLKDFDAALSVAVLNDEVDYEAVWDALAEILFQQNEFTTLKKILRYIPEGYQKTSRLEACVKKIKASDDLLLWLSFVESYCVSIKIRSCGYTFTPNLTASLPLIMAYQPFSVICERFKKWSESTSQQVYLEQFYIELLLVQSKNIQALEAILPKELEWLKKLKLVLHDEKYFPLLLEIAHGNKNALITQAIHLYVERNLSLTDEQLVEKIIAITTRLVEVESSSDDEGEVRKELKQEFNSHWALLACQACVAAGRCEVVFSLLLRRAFENHWWCLDKVLLEVLKLPLTPLQYDLILQVFLDILNSSKDEILLQLSTHALSEQQYRLLLGHVQVVDKEGCGYDYAASKETLEKIPQRLVDEERLRRQRIKEVEEAAKQAEKIAKIIKQQEEESTKDARMVQRAQGFKQLANIINRRHPNYRECIVVVEHLFKMGEFALLLELCQKIAKSKYRDEVVVKLLKCAIKARQYTIAQKCLKLFLDTAHNKSLQSIIQLYQADKQATLFVALMALDQTSAAKIVDELLIICAENILNSQNPQGLQLLIDQGVFEFLKKYYDSPLLCDAVQRLGINIAERILAKIRDVAHFIRYLNLLKEKKRQGFLKPMLTVLLAQGKLDMAIQLMNVAFEIEPLSDGYSRSTYLTACEIELEEYLKNCVLSDVLLFSLAPYNEYAQTRLLQNLWADIFKQRTEQALLLIITIGVVRLKVQYLVNFLIDCLKLGSFILARKAALYFDPEEKRSFGLSLVQQFELQQYAELINFLFSNGMEQAEYLQQEDYIWSDGLFSLVVDRWIRQEETDDLFELLLSFHGALGKLDQKKEPDEHDSEAASKHRVMKAMLTKIYVVIYVRWYDALKESENYLLLLAGVQGLLAVPRKYSCFATSPASRLATIAKELFNRKYYEKVFVALDVFFQEREKKEYEEAEWGRDDYYPVFSLIDLAFKQFLQENNPYNAKRLLVYIKNDARYLKELYLQLADYYFEQKNYGAAAAEVLAYGDSYPRSSIIEKWVMKLFERNDCAQAEVWIKQFFPGEYAAEAIYIKAIEQLISQKRLSKPKYYIDTFLSRPSIKLRLQQQLQMVYLAQMKNCVGDARVETFHALHEKAVRCTRMLNNPSIVAIPNEISCLRSDINELVVELRGQLDKAFLAFYRANYGEPPTGQAVYFPVVPELSGKTIEKKLDDYFSRKLKKPNFPHDYSTVFLFLLEIQPLGNPQYLWLQYLYKLANRQKHDEDLPLAPEINGDRIDMKTYLPQIVDGVFALLLRLFQSKLSAEVVKALTFSEYVRVNSYDVRGTLFAPSSRGYQTRSESQALTPPYVLKRP